MNTNHTAADVWFQIRADKHATTEQFRGGMSGGAARVLEPGAHDTTYLSKYFLMLHGSLRSSYRLVVLLHPTRTLSAAAVENSELVLQDTVGSHLHALAIVFNLFICAL